MSNEQASIIALPHKDLRQTSKKVGLLTDEIKSIVSKMESATLDWEDSREHEVGVALAAVQIDHLLKLIIIRNNFEDKTDRNFNVFINPKITKYEGALEEDFEGCLSIRDIYGKVPRYNKVRIQAQDINGKSVRITAEGFLARVFQHEVDHTKGIMFIDHIKDSPEAFFKLESDGHLNPLDYKKDVKNNSLLW